MLTGRQTRFLAESIPQQVWTAQPDTGALDFVNMRVVDYFGRPANELLGAGWLACIHPDDARSHADAWQSSLATGAAHEVNLRLRRHDGLWRWHLSRAVAYRDDDDVIVKWVGTNTDVDDGTRARDELQQRTAFEQQLIGIVSHDLRNPLNTIALSAAILEEGAPLDERRRAAVTRIVSSTSRASRLIGDLLDFSQARSAGTLPIHPEPTSLRQIVGRVVAEHALASPDRRIIFEAVDDDRVVVDPDRMGQVVDNLVGNALQHSPPDASVRVRSGLTEEIAFIEVRNRGCIDVDDLARLFQPFQQGTKRHPPAARSVGLGLYIASIIVRAHGGSIVVTSSEGTDTCFEVQLPRVPPSTSSTTR